MHVPEAAGTMFLNGPTAAQTYQETVIADVSRRRSLSVARTQLRSKPPAVRPAAVRLPPYALRPI